MKLNHFMRNPAKLIAVLSLSAAIFLPAIAAEQKSYSPYASGNYPTQPYWGDTHLHTNLSWDAYNFGNRKLGPEEAYRFARGEAVTANNGMVLRRPRPLDFLVIADHGSNMGVMNALAVDNPNALKTPLGREWHKRLGIINEAAKTDADSAWELSIKLFIDGFLQGKATDDKQQGLVWRNANALADKFNDPGVFTALIGYEYTSVFFNLHRVVIFKDNAEKTGQVVPFTQYDSSDPEDLWAYLDNYEKKTGGEVLAIPHNGNLSAGAMFALEDAKGNPLSKAYAKTRSRWEPLYEMTQKKGDAETHSLLSPNDEFADFETWSRIELFPYADTQKQRGLTDFDHWIEKHKDEPNADWMHRYEYARSALKLGIGQQALLGINPFKFGMIGSTDAHSSLSSVAEKYPTGAEPSDYRAQPASESNKHSDLKSTAGGYAAVWATENTRESLFSAMKRRETYATTGTRMTLRFFGGWHFDADDAFRPDLAQIGYRKGVPMGGDLSNAPKNTAPRFLIRAVKDPQGANLDRVQVIKGWRDKSGELHEQIYNVALSDNRQDKGADTKPVGSTVSLKDASYTNSIGDAELATVWTDPDFNPKELAFYYVRVLEIPTPRWNLYDAVFYGLKGIGEDVPKIIQERAYTSPIWYTP